MEPKVPPEGSDQVTAAVPPAASVALNCSVVPLLQPLQLVSMAAVPGVTVKVPLDALALLEELVAVTPPPHPARTRSAGKITRAKTRMRRGAAPGRDAGWLRWDWSFEFPLFCKLALPSDPRNLFLFNGEREIDL